MPRYAILEGNRVKNIVEADATLAASQGWVPAGSARMGDMHVNGSFVQVIIEPGKTVVSPVEFKLLFTFQELAAIRGAVDTDPVLKEFYGIVDDPRLTEVDLSLSAVSGALDYLVSKGLLTSERKTEIQSGVLK